MRLQLHTAGKGTVTRRITFLKRTDWKKSLIGVLGHYANGAIEVSH